MSVRSAVLEGPAARARQRRTEWLMSEFPELPSMRVVDLGGRAQMWETVEAAHVTIVNLEHQADRPGKAFVNGDVCDPTLLEDERFDLVFSNSVIEHLGGHSSRQAFASNVRRLAPLHWIQTPYRYFPVEPHWLFPLMQHLPMNARAAVARSWPLGESGRLHGENALRQVMAVDLLSATEMAYYFPDSNLLRERVAGLTKSLIAVRSS